MQMRYERRLTMFAMYVAWHSPSIALGDLVTGRILQLFLLKTQGLTHKTSLVPDLHYWL